LHWSRQAINPDNLVAFQTYRMSYLQISVSSSSYRWEIWRMRQEENWRICYKIRVAKFTHHTLHLINQLQVKKHIKHKQIEKKQINFVKMEKVSTDERTWRWKNDLIGCLWFHVVFLDFPTNFWWPASISFIRSFCDIMRIEIFI